ncbi:hypothetical protein IMCC1989_2078 [gamma proteobacterium IMCC1989]|nr:hypothetical protein IMCC1989_2078 [gamma proteobacterium IMCC1989]
MNSRVIPIFYVGESVVLLLFVKTSTRSLDIEAPLNVFSFKHKPVF